MLLFLGICSKGQFTERKTNKNVMSIARTEFADKKSNSAEVGLAFVKPIYRQCHFRVISIANLNSDSAEVGLAFAKPIYRQCHFRVISIANLNSHSAKEGLVLNC